MNKKNVKNYRKFKDNFILGLIYISSFITFSILVWILVYVLSRGLPQINMEFLSSAPKGDDGGGIFQ